ncbi:MAG: hypothetical protein J6D21_08985 [Clostridia bacterium]|nr:hypothetical protein [Clostridia bacterium]
MLKRAFKSYAPLLLVSVGYMLFSSNIWLPQPVIMPLPHHGLAEVTEMVAPAVLLLALSFLLYNRYEIELALVCGVKTARLAFVKTIPILTYTFVAAGCMILCHRSQPYSGGGKIHIPIYVPENYKLLMIVSICVSLLFFAALFLFLRVLMRNCYIPMALGFGFWGGMSGISYGIRQGQYSPTKCWMDPFISTYFIGDTIPNAMAEQYTDLTSLTNAWTYNRLMFFGLAVVLLVATWLLLRREKLHEGFGD